MRMQKALFAAGCFWGVQYYFDQVPGVVKSVVGYTGGHTANPSYEDVCYRDTGHAEAVLLEFDPATTDYKTLLRQFFRMHNPTQKDRQGPDVGSQYRSAIYYFDTDQKAAAEAALAEAQAGWDEPIVTVIAKAAAFYPAEEYHQKFTERTGQGMCHVPYKPV